MRNHVDSSRTATVTRTAVIEKMEANRDKHRDTYLKALANYEKELRKLSLEVGEMLTAWASSDEPLREKHVSDALKILQELEAPVNYLNAYDEAISLFKWDESEQVELTRDEFRKYILDKWDWQNHFGISTSRYLGN